MSYYYLDDDGCIQGPFTSSELFEWYQAGYFTQDTLLLPATNDATTTINNNDDDGMKKDEIKQQFKPFQTFFREEVAKATAATAMVEEAVSTSPAASDPPPPPAPALVVSQSIPVAGTGTAAETGADTPTPSAIKIPPPPPPRPSPPPAQVVQTAVATPDVDEKSNEVASSSAVGASLPDAAASVAPSSSSSSSPLVWYYLDDSGMERGPYPSSDMSSWFEAGFFNGDTKLRSSKEEACRPMSQRTKEQETFITKNEATATNADTTTTTTTTKVLNVEDEFEVDMDEDDDESENDDSGSVGIEEKSKMSDEKEQGQADDDDVPMVDAEIPHSSLPPSEQHWFYTDTDGIIRGPFNGLTMLKWHRRGFFLFNSTPLRRLDETEAMTLSERTVAPSFFDAKLPQRKLEDRWYYLDLAKKEHGPFTGLQMRQWIDAGQLKLELQVRQVGDEDDSWRSIVERKTNCIFMNAKLKHVAPPPPPPPPPHPIQTPYAMPPYGQQPHPQHGYYPPPQPYHPQAPTAPVAAGYPGADPYNEPYRPHFPPSARREVRNDYTQAGTFSTRGRGKIVASGFETHAQPPHDRDLRQMNHFMPTDQLDRWQEGMNQREAQKQQYGGRGGGGGGRGGYRGGRR